MIKIIIWWSAWLAAITFAAGSWLQWLVPSLYPWPLVLALLIVVGLFIILIWPSTRWVEALVLSIPLWCTLVALILAHILAEGLIARGALTIVSFGLPFISLQLLTTLLYQPSRYPLQGLPRWNEGLAVICAFLISTAESGIFLLTRAPSWWGALASLVLYSVLLLGIFWPWREPEASTTAWIWWEGGVLLALHITSWLILLPLSMTVHGLMAAGILAALLRAHHWSLRRTATRLRLFEVAVGIAAWCLLLIEVKWV